MLIIGVLLLLLGAALVIAGSRPGVDPGVRIAGYVVAAIGVVLVVIALLDRADADAASALMLGGLRPWRNRVRRSWRNRGRPRLALGLVAVIAALCVAAPAAQANPYLTLDRARNFALNHVWYDECNGYQHCSAFPQLDGSTYRIGDSKVNVGVYKWTYSLGRCSGDVYVRTLEDNSLKVYFESLYIC